LFPEGAVFLGLKVLWFLRRRRRSGRGASAISSQEKPRVEVEERGRIGVLVYLLTCCRGRRSSSSPPTLRVRTEEPPPESLETAADDEQKKEESSCRVYV